MPSVFPGMDPFIEGDEWEDFHANIIVGISDALVPFLRPNYLVRIERRVYREPVGCTLPGPVEVREKYLVIRKLHSAEVVTVIEVLSPSNKRAGSEGREEYLAKREEVLQSRTNLVELDLLRGGARLPTLEPPPEGVTTPSSAA